MDGVHIYPFAHQGYDLNASRHAAAGPAKPAGRPARRATYRHGDLRRALLDAGIALVREGGPSALVLREATRRAGVVPNAAYRHFAGHAALLDAVRGAALGRMARAMEAEIAAATRRLRDPAARARAAFKAVGTGYVRFALTEPGLFRTAFVAQPFDVADQGREDFRGDSGRDPFQILCATLDELVAAGALAAARRPGAEFLAWSAVHGLAMLALDGPLRALPPAQVEALAQRAVAMVEHGLAE
jgi:AcrR family transcriptional regulator